MSDFKFLAMTFFAVVAFVAWLGGCMMMLRRVVYRLGMRPKSRSIFYSPSLAVQYAEWEDFTP